MVYLSKITYLSPQMLNDGILINNLTLSYERHPAVHHLSCAFPSGSMTAIIGPNGGGKSTLLRALAGLHPIDEGIISRDAAHSLENTAYLPQSANWDRTFPITVKELTEQALIKSTRLWRNPNSNQNDKIRDSLEKVGLWDQRNLTIDHLSLGQFQRALFARVILQNANLILFDEPLTGLDEPSINDFFKLIHTWNKEGKTIVVVLHDRNLILQNFETTLFLAKEMKAWGKSKEILVNYPWTKAHFQIPNSFSEEECLR